MINQEQARLVLSRVIYDRDFFLSVDPILKSKYFVSPLHNYFHRNIKAFESEQRRMPDYTELVSVCLNNIRNESSKFGFSEKVFNEENIKNELHAVYKTSAVKSIVEDVIVNICQASEVNETINKFTETSNFGKSAVDILIARLMRISESTGGAVSAVPVSQKLRTIGETNSREVVAPTPWKSINYDIKGGLAVGEYALLLAYSNVGKSTTLVRVGMQALLNHTNVLHITLEDPEREVMIKYTSAFTGVDRDTIDSGKGNEAIQEFENALVRNQIGQLFIVEEMEYCLKASQVVKIVEQHERVNNCKIGLVIVDYAQILKPEGAGDGVEVQGDWAALEDTHRTLRKVGRIVKAGVWSAHQAAEPGPGEKRKPILKLNHMGKARACGQVPEFMVSQNEGDENPDVLDNDIQTLYMCRNRLGRKYREVNVKVDHSTVKIEEC